MGFYADNDIKIARRTATQSAFAFTRHANLSAVIYASRNPDFNLALTLHFACAMTGSAFFLDNAPCPAAVRTSTTINHAAKRCILYNLLLS
ncbi:hypothetical protein D3C78_1051620 [compost metagenome]